MPEVQRIGDVNTAGGMLDQTPQDFVTVDGQLVAVVGAEGSAHYPCGTTDPNEHKHCYHVWTTTVGAPRVRINGMPVIRRQDPDSCGHLRAGGSPTTRIGDGDGTGIEPPPLVGWDESEWDAGEWDT